jgi:hypothetical protein
MKDGTHGWHWQSYFEDAKARPYDWGGADWIRSGYSKKLLRERARRGDVILCYQVDDQTHGRVILGLTRMVSGGRPDPASGEYNSFRIDAPASGLSS